MNKIIYLLFLCLFVFGNSISAQQINHVQGNILIKTEKDGNIKHALRDLATINGVSTDLKVKKVVVETLDMYLLSFDFAAIDERIMLDKVARHNDIMTAQFNHLTSLRLEPNDPQFGDQWQYINNGQDGGMVGADIDMDLAWDITTGGVTANGDTIVVAIIDDGLDFNHSDFEDNLWENWGEIPDNGIDDDNNGYVDDRIGWNTGTGSDDIGGGGHGTPVTGIIGAKGNNGIGVAGVSWDVKLMIVQGGTGVESEVLEAYGYIYSHRLLYNETNGAEGAFVVSTNASWGINNGQPDDAPLWCGFYDTLGEEGILNCGATANANFNIDVTSDLPTGCPSDYMIAVTNMNRNDVKVTQAGYGLETIDLGAFGQDTWTTAFGDGYGGFGGTSGATPHVTGSIGLLYSAPCSNLANLAMSDPAAAALAVRSYIFGGVDPNASLEGITVTGGRLNVRNSLDLLIADCGPCPPPSSLEALNITVDAADFSWSSVDNATSDTLQYRAVGAADWIEIAAAITPYNATGLLACTDYEFRVKSSCPEEPSGYSSARIFRTDGCCNAPENVIVADATEEAFTVSWDALTAAISYNVRWRALGTTDWSNADGEVNTSFMVTGLNGCAEYEVQVATVCTTETTAYSASVTALTSGCGACTDNDYCDRPSGNVSDEWIETVSIAGVIFNSGENGGETSFFGNPTVIDVSQTLVMTMEPGYSGTIYNEAFTVWIDLNQDGTFDSNELLYTSSLTDNEVTANINIPVNALNGVTRMRVRMNYNVAQTDPCLAEEGFYGETEDYCVEITNGEMELTCDEVENIVVEEVENNSLTLSWDESPNAVSYSMTATPADGEPIVTTSNDNQATLSGLAFCTTYTIVIQAVCESGTSEGTTIEVSTACCADVTDLNEASNTENSIIVEWTETDEAESYTMRYQNATGGAFTVNLNVSSPYTIEDLLFCTAYNVEVKAICTAGGESEFILQEMTTSCISASEDLIVEADEMRLFPNPFTDKLQLEMNLNSRAENLQIEVLNTAGQLLSVQTQAVLNAGRQVIPVDMKDRTAGVYFVRISTDAGSAVRRVVRTN